MGVDPLYAGIASEPISPGRSGCVSALLVEVRHVHVGVNYL